MYPPPTPPPKTPTTLLWGRAAVLFAAEGARVGAADVNTRAAEETAARIRAAGGEAVALACNVADPEANRRMVATAVEQGGGVRIFWAYSGCKSCPPHAGHIGLETISLD